MILDIVFTIHHVKGHQLEALKKEYNITGPLTREAHYNDMCDALAEKQRKVTEKT